MKDDNSKLQDNEPIISINYAQNCKPILKLSKIKFKI